MAQTTVNFNLKTAGFANYANQTLTFRLLTAGADKTDDTVTLAGVVTATSAANGTGSVALFNNGDSDINSIFEVIFPNREKAKFLIPAGTSSIHLSDLLVDHVPGGSDTQQSSVYAEAIKRANHTGSLSLDSLPNGSITGTLAVANGGTNASSASAARTSLGAQEQKNVLDDLGALSAPSSEGQFIVATGVGAFQYQTPAAVKTTLGLGTIATQALDSVNIDGGSIDGVVIGANSSAVGTFSTLNGPTTNLVGGGDNLFITSAELTKLSGIETAATADQTGAEIKAAYEGEANTNAFTDADNTKLNGISTGANVTNDTTVALAGALMESALTSPANVKALNQSLVSGAAPNLSTANMVDAADRRFMSTAQENKLDGIAAGATGNLTNNEIRDAVEAADDSNTFTNADHDKLNGIDTSADVTNATTVEGAGALMDSECAGGDPTNVKALNQSVVAGASPNFATTNMTDASNKRLMTDAQETTLDSLVLTAGSVTTINAFARDSLLNSNATSIRSALSIPDTGAIAGFVPKSITFPTTSDFLSIADSADLDVGTDDFTLSFWARLDGTGTEPILNKYSGAGYSLKFSSGSLILTIQGTGDPLAVTLATGLNDNKWHVYVVTVDRSANAVAYVDNVAQTGVSVSTVQSSLDNSTAFRIGYDGANASSEIAFGNYVALHKSVLTASQAAQIYFSADAALTLLNPVVAPALMVDLRRADKTFTDVSASPLAIVTNGTVRFNQDRITSLDGVGDINCSSISSDVAATGLNVIFDGTDTGDNKITLTDNLASALDITESTNSYLKFTTTNTGEKVVLGKDLDISGDHDLIIGTSTGTKIGTATSQKIGFFNATPVVQQNTTGTTTGTTGGSGTALHTNATITGGVGSTAYTVGDIVKALKQLGLLAE
jgi:hypothetical protein